ncbi:MAG: sensor histidine kinase [Gammaproteobacteria bacterium]
MAARYNRYTAPDTAKRRLRWLLLAFFGALALPLYLLLEKVYAQLENEAFFRQRSQAEQFVQRVDRRVLDIVEAEQKRPIAEYSFFNILENPLLKAPTVNFSPLSEIPPRSSVPGLMGYFQINPDGSFGTPLLPDLDPGNQAGLSVAELQKRMALKNALQALLSANGRAKPDASYQNVSENDKKRSEALPPPDENRGYRFDEVLSSGDDSDARNEAKDRFAAAAKKQKRTLSKEQLRQLNIDAERWQQKPAAEAEPAANYLSRREKVKLPTQSLGALFDRSAQPTAPAPAVAEAKQEEAAPPQSALEEVTAGQMPLRIFSFESEVGPLQVLRLNADYWCFFRQVWRNNSRYIQGFIVNGGDFFAAVLQPYLGGGRADAFSSLLLAYDGKLLKQFKLSPENREALLYRASLSAPLANAELLVNTGPALPGAGSLLVDLLAAVLATVLLLGILVFYRLGMGQIELARRQRNFISAVSHELKTPLTSIRMYAEMLRADWIADEAKKRSYYDFIFFESERLSRLIANVLQLAKLDNHRERVQLAQLAPEQLLQRVQGKIAAQLEAAGLQLHLLPYTAQAENLQVAVDEDAFFQIVINLIDNAVKFAAGGENKRVDVGFKPASRGREAIFFVRDYGPGIERGQMKKIFRLFYRCGDELTRTKPGTGIGLALVAQLAARMQAKIDVLNREPGVEFQLKLPLATPSRKL